MDNMDSTFLKTESTSYPWIQVWFRRKMRITKVEILSGEEPLMNLEVRVGDDDLSGTDGDTRMTGNTRCGMYYGPTLVEQQWVTVDCGLPRGLKGKYLTLQLLERFGGNTPLEISQVDIFGWGRTCGNEDPDE